MDTVGGENSSASERWQRLRSLFHESLSLTAEQRPAFCSHVDDPILRAELETLLSEAEGLDDGFLSSPPREVSDGLAVPEPLLGLILKGRYRVEGVVGQGGQGTVLLARDVHGGERMIIKLLRGAGDHAAWLRRRFDQERAILSQLNHPGIIGIRDYGELEGTPFLVLEYVDGLTLRQRLKAGIPAREVADIVRQIGSALRAAHQLGVCHRDLKPENIMLTAASLVKLIDFGIAQVYRKTDGATTTVLMVAGTSRYMAPEQFLGISNERTDVYSFGIVIFEMLAGDCPYGGADALGLARAQRARSIGSILETSGGIPRRLAPVLRAALALDPEQRPENAEAFANQVADCILLPEPTLANRLAAFIRGLGRSMVFRWALLAVVLALMAWPGVLKWQEAHIAYAVETAGGADPVSNQFEPHNDVSGTVVFSEDGTSMEAWVISTHSQGHYFRKLSSAQLRVAMRNGWTLTVVGKPLEGELGAQTDFVKLGPQFIMCFAILNGKLVARSINQYVPDIQATDAPLDVDPTAYHEYKMTYDPRAQSATIAVDGKIVIRDYRGMHQFQDGLNVDFGCDKFQSKNAQASFKLVRFEILPKR